MGKEPVPLPASHSLFTAEAPSCHMNIRASVELDFRYQTGFVNGSIPLSEALMYWAHSGRPLPDWLIHELEFGFKDAVEGKRSLESSFGLQRRSPTQPDKEARRLTYGPAVYNMVKGRGEGKAIDLALFVEIARTLAPDFRNDRPDKEPPGARTLQEWYLAELQLREPELKKARARRQSKTD